MSVNPEERRVTFRLLSYWNRMRGEREFPSLADIDITVIPELWHHTFTIEVHADLSHCKFQNFGPELSHIFGTSYAGEPVMDALAGDFKLESTIGYFPEVLRRREPVADSSQFYLEGDEVKYRSLIVPLSSNGRDIDYLLGTTNYKVFGKGA